MRMEQSSGFEDMLVKERNLREQNLTTLESLSGYNRLSERQRQYMRLSFYIQQRAERGTDPGSASHIFAQPARFEKLAPGGVLILDPNKPPKDSQLPEKGAYFSSQSYIAAEYCHRAVSNLEAYREGNETAPEWHELGLAPSYEQLEEVADTFNGQPCVVEVWYDQPGHKTSIHLHTSLILGRNQSNELICWEKAGYSSPFQLLSLKQVYNAYVDDEVKKDGWRIRPLLV